MKITADDQNLADQITAAYAAQQPPQRNWIGHIFYYGTLVVVPAVLWVVLLFTLGLLARLGWIVIRAGFVLPR